MLSLSKHQTQYRIYRLAVLIVLVAMKNLTQESQESQWLLIFLRQGLSIILCHTITLRYAYALFRSLKNHIPKLGMDPIADNTAKSNEKRGEMKVYSIPSAPATS